MEMREVFYEFLVRGEFDRPDQLGQIKGAQVQYWPMGVENGEIRLRGELGPLRALAAGDPLPPAIATQINAAALVTVNALCQEVELITRDRDRAIAEKGETTTQLESVQREARELRQRLAQYEKPGA